MRNSAALSIYPEPSASPARTAPVPDNPQTAAGESSTAPLDGDSGTAGSAAPLRVPKDDEDTGALVWCSRGMQEILEQVQRVAACKVAVLIEGETGTGKELVARQLHQLSRRARQPFVRLNCAALSESLVESELFGHEKGAFTGAVDSRPGRFETADGGSLLLDEISEMPVKLQAKLLRVLEEEEFERVGGARTLRVDVRVIATSNRCLEQEITRGNFRQDLYYRLNAVHLCLPPLRARRDDIAILAEHFFARYRHEASVPLRGFASKTLALLAAYDWPGNVRQLRNVVQRACILARGRDIQPADLPPFEKPAAAAALPGKTLAEMERALILRTLQEQDGNRTATAAQLGVTTRTLLNKLKQYQRLGAA